MLGCFFLVNDPDVILAAGGLGVGHIRTGRGLCLAQHSNKVLCIIGL